MLDFNGIVWYYCHVMTAEMCKVADTPGVVVWKYWVFAWSESILDIGEGRLGLWRNLKFVLNLKVLITEF